MMQGQLDVREIGLEDVYQCRTDSQVKKQNRNNVYRSPYVEEPLNSKIIKVA